MLTFRDFPAHVRLLLLSARTRLRDIEIDQINSLAASNDPEAMPLDWNGFLAVTAHHRVSPLAFESLDLIRPAGVPAFVRDELQRRARGNALEAMRSASEVGRITATFADVGIPLAVLKGVPLSQYLYGNPNSRHVGDIDLLIPPNRLPEQIALLEELGYRRINPRFRLTPHRLASYVQFWKDFTFRSPQSRFELDLHWRLFNNRFHAANRIVTESDYTSLTCFGTPMRTFAPRDQFLYIAAHGILDAWTYLKSLADVAAFLRVFTADELDAALVRADELRLLAQISGAIHLCNDWMGSSVSSPLLLPASDPVGQSIRVRTTSMLLRQNFRPNRSFASPAQWLKLEMELVPGLRSQAEIASRFLWRPRVWSAVDLPDKLFWIYPVLGLLIPPRRHSVGD